MYSTGNIREQQKHGIVACIPKTTAPKTPPNHRPIALLNSDYKILARIVASHLRPVLAELLHQSQHERMHGGDIFDAVVTVRDPIAYAEKTQTPLFPLARFHGSVRQDLPHVFFQAATGKWF